MTRRIALLQMAVYALLAWLCTAQPCMAADLDADAKPEVVYDTPAAIQQALQDARNAAAEDRHYSAAAIYFNVYTSEGDQRLNALGYLTESLVKAGFQNAASYFFIKTLQSGNRASIRRVLPYLPALIEEVGGDLLRKYVTRYTSEADYDANAKNHFFYFLGKDELLKGDPAKALQYLSKVASGSGVLIQAAYLKGVAYAQLNQTGSAISAFTSCRRMAANAESKSRSMRQEMLDLEARCTASLARSYYQSGDHDQAEQIYDDIPKASFVWTDILFEQAWNAFAKGDYNRTLGKLVTYHSPALGFVFNPEVDVLRAQTFLSLCMYDDVNKVLNEFNQGYAGVGSQMKNFLLSHEGDLSGYYGLARQVYGRKLHSNDMMSRALNRFIRGPYFAGLVAQERAANAELRRVSNVASSGQKGTRGFSSFLGKVLHWRVKSIRLLGGAFVKNSMYDLYQDLLANLDKMSFIKLEMLKQAKTKLERPQAMSRDEDGVMKRGRSDVPRRDYQYFWTFNGEFWVDEMGDYVFALESQCK